MKIEPDQTAASRYFGPGDSKISTSRAGTLLGCSDRTVRRYLEKGILRGSQAYPGAYCWVSKLSVLELKAKFQRQVEHLEPLS